MKRYRAALRGAPKKVPHGQHLNWRNVVLTLVERGGQARSFHVEGTTVRTLLPIIRANIRIEAQRAVAAKKEAAAKGRH